MSEFILVRKRSVLTNKGWKAMPRFGEMVKILSGQKEQDKSEVRVFTQRGAEQEKQKLNDENIIVTPLIRLKKHKRIGFPS